MRGHTFNLALSLLPVALGMPTLSSSPDSEYCGGSATVTVTCTAPYTVTFTPIITVTGPAETVTASLSSSLATTAAAPVSISQSSVASSVGYITLTTAGVTTSSAVKYSTIHYYPNSTITTRSSYAGTGYSASSSTPWTTSRVSSVVISKPTESGTTSQVLSSVSAVSTKSTTSSAPVSDGKSKRGVIMPLDDPADVAAYVKAFGANTPKISWTGNFFSGPPSSLSPTIEFVPQRYNVFASDDHDWIINANKAINAGEKYLLSYGEPGLKSSNPMDAQTGANYWKKQLQPFTANATVGAPCMGSMDYDFTWLEDFLGYCDACDIGFIAVHWINTLSAGGGPSSAANFKSVVAHAVSIAKGKPVWIDNIRASGAHADTVAFLSDIVPWLDQNDAVARYAYFGPAVSDASSLITADGSLTALGSFYANL